MQISHQSGARPAGHVLGVSSHRSHAFDRAVRHPRRNSSPPTLVNSSPTHHAIGTVSPLVRRASTLTTAAAAAATAATPAPAGDLTVDVAIIGAGIIGLTTALALLRADSTISVALIDQKEPCAGATGAGQGYLWQIHRDPSSPAWEVAARSNALWKGLLDGGALAQADLEWQRVGSLLIATTAAEAAALEARGAALRAAGVDADFLPDGAAVRAAEPALAGVPDAGGGLMVAADAQINGKRTTAAVVEACQSYGPRFTTLFYEKVAGLAPGGVATATGRHVNARAGVIVAAGAWGGEFLARELGIPAWAAAVRPRRGLLLELAPPPGLPLLHRGAMEAGYTRHYDSEDRKKVAAGAAGGEDLDITFTATTSAAGTLLIGSSREFGPGYGDENLEEVTNAILDRAEEFMPGLRGVDRAAVSVRWGPRPFSPTGPLVGEVAHGLYAAVGHEGSGLTLGPATAELLTELVLGSGGMAGHHALSTAAVASLRPPPELRNS